MSISQDTAIAEHPPASGGDDVASDDFSVKVLKLDKRVMQDRSFCEDCRAVIAAGQMPDLHCKDDNCTRRCVETGCGTKPVRFFSVLTAKDGHKYRCKPCINAIATESRVGPHSRPRTSLSFCCTTTYSKQQSF